MKASTQGEKCEHAKRRNHRLHRPGPHGPGVFQEPDRGRLPARGGGPGSGGAGGIQDAGRLRARLSQRRGRVGRFRIHLGAELEDIARMRPGCGWISHGRSRQETKGRGRHHHGGPRGHARDGAAVRRARLRLHGGVRERQQREREEPGGPISRGRRGADARAREGHARPPAIGPDSLRGGGGTARR